MGAGLAAAQALRARDVPFVVYEAGSGIGGNWRDENDSGLCSAYASLTTNVSRQRTSYRCFPLRSGPLYLHHTRMLGVAGAYVVVVATYLDDLGYLARIPLLYLVLIVVGVPWAAIAAGWLLSGREPPAIARPAIE